MNTIANCAIFALLAVASIVIRNKEINQPMNIEHWLPAHVLTTVKMWNEEGIAKHHFSPVYNSPHYADRGNKFLGGVKSEDLRCYYISYPPMAFLAPWAVFKTFGAEATPINLSRFSIFLHLLSALLIMLILSRLYGKSWRDGLFLPAIIAGTWYMLSAGTLHYYGTNFFSDVLVQPFLLLQLFLLLKWMDQRSKSLAFGIAILAFFGIYTEYQMVFQAAVIFFIALWGKQQAKWRLPVFLVLAGSLALGLMFYQYSSISGSDALVEALTNKFEERSGMQGDGAHYTWSSERSWELLDEHFGDAYTVLMQFSFLFILLGIVASFFAGLKYISKREGLVLGVVLVPILLHYLVFFNFNALHDFGGIKLAVPMCVLIGIASHKILTASEALFFRWRWIAMGLLVTYTAMRIPPNLAAYDEMPIQVENIALWKEIGEKIKEASTPDDVIFVEYFNNIPVIWYYSDRTVFGTSGYPQASKSMKWNKELRALYLGVDKFKGIDTVAYIYGEHYHADKGSK